MSKKKKWTTTSKIRWHCHLCQAVHLPFFHQQLLPLSPRCRRSAMLYVFFIEEQWVVICIYPLWYVVQETVHATLNIREMTGKFSEVEQHCHTPLTFKRLHYGHFHCKYELYFCFISLLVTLSVHNSSDNDLKKIQFKV